MLGFNDTSALGVILCRLPGKERKEIKEIVEAIKEKDKEERKNRNESEETEEIKTFLLYHYLLQG